MNATETLFRQAVEHHLAGRLKEASQTYQEVLARAPQHAQSLHLLGAIAYQLGRNDIAVTLIESAIAIDDGVAAFHNDLGEIYRGLGRPADATRQFRRAIQLAPELGSAHNNLGILLQGEGRLGEAVSSYRRAVELMPGSSEPLSNLACALIDLGDTDGATAPIEEARRLAPDDAGVALNLGNLLLLQGKPAAAVTLYREALSRQPGYVLADVNLGRALTALGRPVEALRHYEAAVAKSPDLASARWNEGVCRLLLGDLARGWEGFAWRWRAGAVPPHGLAAPEWSGGPLAGRHLLVHAEQGLGDTIQFARFLPQLAALGPASLTLLVQTPLTRLLAGMVPLVTADEPLPEHDLRIPLLDLPRRFGTTLDSIPVTPYLAADPALVAAWTERLAATPGRRVGLVWQGRRDHANDRQRSLPPALLEPLLAIPGAAWFSLQKEGGAPQGTTDLGPLLDDMAETAAAIMALDLVITVDTAVAHLAGALGRPVWILLPFAPDWRWLVDRADSPWYPTARLFRQNAPGNWESVLGAVADALRSSASAP